MCVAAVAWNAHPDYLLIAIGNRDEFHDRTAAQLSYWDDGSGIIAGRDLRAGGTWLGVTDAGLFALLTNFRNPAGFAEAELSRGSVVPDLLHGSMPKSPGRMNPFNAVVAGQGDARFLTNYPSMQESVLNPGVVGLSNGPLGKPWPKTIQLCSALTDWLNEPMDRTESLFDALRAETPRPCDDDPEDGPQPDYAPVFIRRPVYGTRCSTVVAVRRDGRGTIAERCFDSHGHQTQEASITFNWSSP